MSDPLARIKELYYRASKATIVRDVDEAIDLLKAMTSENERERATVYMHGLAEMKSQWHPPSQARSAGKPTVAQRTRRK
jgi:hypothetical protein